MAGEGAETKQHPAHASDAENGASERAWRPPAPPIPLGPLPSERLGDLEWLDARLRSASAELERSSERARKLHAVTAAMLGSVTPAQVAETAIKEGAAVVGASGGLLLTVTAEDRIDVAGAVRCPMEVAAWLRGRPIGQAGPFATVIRTGEPAWLGTLPFVARERGETREAWALLPLMVRERTFGVFGLRFEGRAAIPDEYRWFLILLAQQCAQALERARLYEAERSARVDAQFAERRVGFLAAVSARLAQSLDERDTLLATAELAATHLADFCAIHVLDADGEPKLAVVITSEDGKLRQHAELADSCPVDFGADIGYHRVLRTGRPELMPIVDDTVLQQAASDEPRLERLRSLGLTSHLCVPIHVRGAVVGAITLAATESGRHFSTADVAIAEEVATRVGQAIENARLYESTLAASRAKSNFLAVMSHELRTPLNAILGYADLVLLDVPEPSPGETRTQVERMRAAARHLLRLVDDVLSFARADAGQERLRIEPVHLTDVVEAALDHIMAAATDKGLAVHSEVDPDAIIHTDVGRLNQILTNLLTNAVKFTARGELEVTASLRDDVAEIRVRDTGIGIAHEHQARIFDAFWQVDQTHTRQFGGAGIGLGVARHLARVLGGDIEVGSEIDSGSTFTLRIPARLEMEPPREPI